MWKQEEVEGGGEGEWERERWVEDRGSLLKNGPTLPDEVAFVGKDVEFKGVITYPPARYGRYGLMGPWTVKFTPTAPCSSGLRQCSRPRSQPGRWCVMEPSTAIFRRRTRLCSVLRPWFKIA